LRRYRLERGRRPSIVRLRLDLEGRGRAQELQEVLLDRLRLTGVRHRKRVLRQPRPDEAAAVRGYPSDARGAEYPERRRRIGEVLPEGAECEPAIGVHCEVRFPGDTDRVRAPEPAAKSRVDREVERDDVDALARKVLVRAANAEAPGASAVA